MPHLPPNPALQRWAGLTSDNCLLYTVHDAYLRRFRLFVPEDGSTALTQRDHDEAMRLIHRTTKADLRKSRTLPLNELGKPKKRRG